MRESSLFRPQPALQICIHVSTYIHFCHHVLSREQMGPTNWPARNSIAKLVEHCTSVAVACSPLQVPTSFWGACLQDSIAEFMGSGVQGWRSGESARLPPMWPGFDSQIRRHMWVEFVGSLLCTERFSPGTPVSPLLKNQHLT